MGVTAAEPQGLDAVWDKPRFVQHLHEDLETFYEGAAFHDDVTGKPLEFEGVKEARRVELEFVDKRPIYEEAPVQESDDVTGRGPIDTKWVNIDRGGPGDHRYRSRWVAKAFTHTSPTTSMPPRRRTRRSNS